MSQPSYRPADVCRDGDCMVLNIPMTFRRHNGRREIILPQGGDTSFGPEPNRALVLALARAWRWQEMLDSGEVGSVDELAKRLHLGSTYVARTLRLTALAPNLVESILAGDEPDGLSLRKLAADLPVDWAEQERLLAGGCLLAPRSVRDQT
jgi:ParB-like chromosome segregation protein Spo0J